MPAAAGCRAARVAVPDLGHARAEPECVLAPGGEVGGGVDVPVGPVAAGVVVAAVGALGEGEFGSHRTTRRALLGAREPPVRDDALPTVAGRLVAQLPGQLAPALVPDRRGE